MSKDKEFQKHAKRLLHNYGYIHSVVSSAPRLLCESPFYPAKYGNPPKKEFCSQYCCLLSKKYFLKMYKYFFGRIEERIKERCLDYLKCCNNQQDIDYVKNLCNSAGCISNSDILEPETNWSNIKNMAAAREQRVMYFWLFSYIYLGPSGRSDFDRLFDLHNDISYGDDPVFIQLINKFDSFNSILLRKGSLVNNESVYKSVDEYIKMKQKRSKKDFIG